VSGSYVGRLRGILECCFALLGDQHIADGEEGVEILIIRDEITDAEVLNHHLEPWPGKYGVV